MGASAQSRWPRSTASCGSAPRRPRLEGVGATNKEPAEKRCCCARSKRFRANATFASPSAAQPMRPFFMDGWRTGSVSPDSRARVAANFANFELEKSMKPLPPPGPFGEGQRLVYGLLAATAGMFCGACAVAMIALLMWGGWSAREEHSIVTIFGWSLAGFIAAMVAVIVGLLAGGPVGRFRIAATRDGASMEADGAAK